MNRSSEEGKGQLHGKVAVITGAASGIGLATLDAFSAAGARVIGADMDGPALERAREALASQGRDVSAVQLDVTDVEAVRGVFARVREDYGGLDHLVNCAGVSRRGPVADLSEEDWEMTLKVNLTSVFLCCKYALPLLIARGGGRIVSIASAAGVVPVPQAPAYCASKAGVILLSQQITKDYLKDGVVANAICPTGVDTPFIERRFAAEGDPVEARARYEATVGPLLKPEEVARVALFLVTDGLMHFPVPYIQ